MTAELWKRETFVEKLRAIGVRGYHDKHPFHVTMNEGRLSPEALRGWVANRFYYQRTLQPPKKPRRGRESDESKPVALRALGSWQGSRRP